MNEPHDGELKRSFSESEIAQIEHVLGHDGYALLMEYVASHGARVTTAIARPTTDWDATNRLRGELKGLEHLFPRNVRKAYQPQSEKP